MASKFGTLRSMHLSYTRETRLVAEATEGVEPSPLYRCQRSLTRVVGSNHPDTTAELGPLARLELAFPLTVSRLGNEADTAAKLALAAGLEPAASSLEDSRSVHLSYASKTWWTRWESDPQPHG